MSGQTAPVYRAAIIGLGFIGGGDQVSGDALGQLVSDLDGTHAEALGRSPRVALVAGSSRDTGRRDRFHSRTGARVYADWRAMLEAEKPELVSVATYAPQHAEMVIECARRGVRALFCEKPIATSPAEADAMLEACRAAGSLLAINHSRRYNPNYRRLRDLVAAGGLGDLTSAALRWGSGRLGNVGTHTMDALVLLTGQRIAGVSGTLDLSRRPDCRGPQFQDPGGWGLLRLEGGLIATVDAADYGAGPLQVVLHGTKGRAIAGGQGVTLDYWDGRREEWPEPPAGETSLDRAVQEIVAWLDGSAEFSPSDTAACNVLEAIAAFHLSHERDGRWVSLPLPEADRGREVRTG